MKDINRMNYFMMGIPVSLIVAGQIFKSELWLIGALLTILTGGYQVIVGIGIFVDSGFKDQWMKIYLSGVALFFSLWIITNWQWIIAIPPLLAVYFSAIVFIYAKKNHTK